MLIFLWIIILCTFFLSFFFLVSILFKQSSNSESLGIFLTAIKNGFNKSGFFTNQKRYPVELYRWELCDYCLDCDDCLERATFEPMDIADWIRLGLPGTPEADTECGDHCSCKLVIVKKKISSKY